MQDLALIPGLNNTRAVFDGVLAALPAHVRGHALDNPPLDTVEAIAAHWLERLPERFWLAGFSFGGYVSLALLALAPERVRGLALVCTSPHSDSAAAAQRRIAALARVAEGGYFDMVEEQAGKAFHVDRQGDEALMARRRAMVRDYGPERYAAHVRATAARPDRSALLDGRKPTLVVTADGDQVIPPDSVRAYARQIPGARLEVIAGAGHLLPMERPAVLAGVLAQWIDASQGGPA